jgi:hypothetical protein
MMEQLDNLARTGLLKTEPHDANESAGLLRSAMDRLKDAHNNELSFASRFDLAYNAAHALALYALRQYGYRSDKRYLVFQCLAHTTETSKSHIRIFSLCHERRNLAEYEGYLDADELLLNELLQANNALAASIKTEAPRQ